MPVARSVALISMLRGVNLGPHKRIRMDSLRALYESLNLEKPQTYVQSGNVIFKTVERDLGKIARRLEEAIEESFGFHSDVILRTVTELKTVVERNPFAGREIEPSKLLVTFLTAEPAPEAREKMLAIDAAPEELHIVGREVYIYFPNGMARPKLPWTSIEKMLKTRGTGRNWNTVTKLLELAERL